MSTHRAVQRGIAALSAVALVASGASPVAAVDPDGVRTLVGLSDPFGVAVNPGDGSVYVANQGGGVDASVLVFEKGQTTHNPTRTLHGVGEATNVAIQPGTGDVYVAEYFANVIHVFEAGSTSSHESFSVSLPWDLEFDAGGTLYVTSFLADRLLTFGPGAKVPTREIVTPPQPMGVAVHPDTGDVYVGHGPLGSVTVFTAGLLIADSSKQLTGAGVGAFLAIAGNTGRVYVQDSDAVTVRAFEPATQIPAPGGDLVGAGFPRGVATDPGTGDVYLADASGDQVLVYPSGSMTVASVSPVVGPVTGGTPVTITGANLGAVAGVSFGGVAATKVVAVSPTTVTAVAPAHAVGKVEVSVSWGSKTAGLANAFDYQAVAPGKATAVSGVPGNGQVTVSWTPPADTGGVPVASYTVTPSPAGPACASAATSCTIAGLTNGTKYRFVVRTTNTANLSSDSDASGEVTPYIATGLSVSKAKAASYKLKRRGSTTLVSSIKVPKNATRVVTRSCTNGTAKTSKQLCTFTVYKKSGKVKVRTKGYRNVVVTLSIQSAPKPSAGPTFGPSPTWTRTWTVR
jgi:DNA-binding beta-propeller fold protein YncE